VHPKYQNGETTIVREPQ
jgi:hypothetical protein